MAGIGEILGPRVMSDADRKRRRFLLIASSGGGGTVTLAAPVLTWVSAAGDNTPDFSVAGALSGSTIDVQISANSNFAVVTQTLSGVRAGDPTTLTAATLADGLWYARAKYTNSDWSNTVSQTIVTAVLRQAMFSASMLNTTAIRQAQFGAAFVTETT
jgi:hypothetical protein